MELLVLLLCRCLGLREALENPSRIDSLFIASSVAKLSDRLSVMAAEEPLAGEMSYYTGATEILIGATTLEVRRAGVLRAPE